MANKAFDTLEATRRLEAAGIRAEQADAFVKVVNQSASQMVTVERFETGVAGLHARIDSVHSELGPRIDSLHTKFDSVQTELLARIDSVRAELREEIARSNLRAVLVAIAANALIVTIIATVATIFGILLSGGAPETLSFGTP